MDNIQSLPGADYKITGNWDAQAKQLQEQFPLLTSADLNFEEGHDNELLSRVETRLNKKREEVIIIIEKWRTKVV